MPSRSDPRRRTRWTGCLAVLLLAPLAVALSTGAGTGAAQEATPVVDPKPDPAECRVAPRSVEGVLALAPAEPAASPAAADLLATPAAFEPPAGEPADAATTAAVTATIRELIACTNAADPLRLFALYTDALVRATLAHRGPVGAESFAPPRRGFDLPREARFGVSVEEVSLLADGRAGARVLLVVPGGQPSGISWLLPGRIQSHYLILVPGEDRWLIDEIHRLEPRVINEIASGEGYLGVIFTPDAAAALVGAVADEDEVDGYWQPHPRDIAALEAALPGYLAGAAPELADRLASQLYVRQYAGFVRDGRPLILVNASCERSDLRWIEEPIVVLDGGACFFRVTYDPVAGTFADLEINAEA